MKKSKRDFKLIKNSKQKTVCKMLREAVDDEKKGKIFYNRLASELSDKSSKKTVRSIASQENRHKNMMIKLIKETGCM